MGKECPEEVVKRIDDEAEVNESVPDFLPNEQPVANTGLNFRPFTPPFAQFKCAGMGRKETGEEIGEMAETASNEQKLDVIYDPILKCYYEPKTGNYYQSNKE